MRKFTVEAFEDVTGWAPKEDSWCAYDTNTYDGAFDAGRQVMGWGSTPEEALADYDSELEEYNLKMERLRSGEQS